MTDNFTPMTQEEVRQKTLANLYEMGFDGDVEVFYANAKSLRENGMLLDLDITGLTMFDARISWSLDLGVDAKDSRRQTKRIRPGRKNLLANTKLQSIAQRIRDNLSGYSQAISIFPGYRYVPYSAFIKWWERHQELVVEWDQYKQWVLDNYEQIRQDCRADFEHHARDTYAKSAVIQRRYDLDSFVNAVVADALSRFPSKARIIADLQVSLKPPATFLLESEYQAEMLRAQRLAEERRTEYEENQLKHDAWRRKEMAGVEKAEADADTAKAERDVVEAEAKSKLRVIEFEESEKVAAIRAAQIEIARVAVADTVNPLVEIVQENRQRIYATLSKLQNNITRRGWVHGKEAAAIRSLVDWFGLMNITDDSEMASKLEKLGSSLETREAGAKSYDADAVLGSLRGAIGTALQDAAGVATRLEIDALGMMDV
jgi:hypothetical protein